MDKKSKIIHIGQVFELDTYGLVKFEGLDYYHGGCAAKLSGITNPNGIYYPKLETLINLGFTIIDD